MFGKKAYLIATMAHELHEAEARNAVLTDRVNQLRHSRIRISIKKEMGVVPIWDVSLEYAIMLTNMHGGAGRELPECVMELISQYTPLQIPDDGDREYDNGIE